MTKTESQFMGQFALSRKNMIPSPLFAAAAYKTTRQA